MNNLLSQVIIDGHGNTFIQIIEQVDVDSLGGRIWENFKFFIVKIIGRSRCKRIIRWSNQPWSWTGTVYVGDTIAARTIGKDQDRTSNPTCVDDGFYCAAIA